MPDAVIVSTARTPIGKAYRGAFNMTHGAELGGHVVKHAVARAGVDPAEVEDVILGCALPERATGGNIARQAAIRAGLPVTVAGMTVNRFCSSGLQTIALAAQRIIAGEASVLAAGGLESISLVQDGTSVPVHDGWIVEHKPAIYMPMIDTADIVAERYKVRREAQDGYALESQRRTASAQQAKRFDDEIVPLPTTKKWSIKTLRRKVLSR
jgi:acetyl-CoA C-acetyltransferase